MQPTTATRITFGRSRAAVAATFATHAATWGTIGPWIPHLKARSGLDAAGLGLVLTASAVGLILGTRLAGPAVRRAGGRGVVRAAVPVQLATLALLPAAGELAVLAAVFAVLGLASGLLDVAMNTEAVAVERRFDKRVMSGMHGTWSASMLSGAGVATIGIGAGLPIAVHLPTVAGLLVISSFPLLRWLPSPHEALHPVADDRVVPNPVPRTGRVVAICVIGFAAFLTEGVAAEWSAVYLRESVGVGAGTAGLGVVAFSAGMAASRFAGDRVSARIGPARLVRTGASTGAAALGIALIVHEPAVSIGALVVLGLTLGPAVPLAFSAAGALGDVRGRSALGLAVTAGYVGAIVGPLAVGFTADQVGLRWAFTIAVVTSVVVAIAAGVMRDHA